MQVLSNSIKNVQTMMHISIYKFDSLFLHKKEKFLQCLFLKRRKRFFLTYYRWIMIVLKFSSEVKNEYVWEVPQNSCVWNV